MSYNRFLSKRLSRIDDGIDDSDVDYGTAIDMKMLESYGITMNEQNKRTIVESMVKDNEDKLFGVDRFLVFSFGDTIDYIFENEIFDAFSKELFENLDDERDVLVYEQWSSDLLKEKLEEYMNGLTKGEVLRYDDYFRTVLKMSGNEETETLISSEDERFSKMPYVVRIH